MADDPLRTYRDAMSEYEAARTEAVGAVKLIAAVHSATTYNLQNFLALTYGLDLSISGRPSREAHIDMAQWPDAAKLQQMFAAWHAALKKLHGAWSHVSAEDRQIAKPPPQTLSLN